MVYSTIKHSTTGKTPSLIEKAWKPLFPVDHLKEDLLKLQFTARHIHDMFKKACYTKLRCIAENREYKLSITKPTHSPQEIVELEDSPGQLHKLIKARNIGLNVKDYRQYLVRFKEQTADKDKLLSEDAIPDIDLHLRGIRASGRAE
ncbi:hypothetical protein O181_092885 [Austropuccinia psidii MF-1]|uniref:Uncharacterized protein n=1 Tax=Austropuccinia psidii MF-1 TaxID=1389203 RepID=A0A9Q3IZE6_9BASI|nr:hypothetical protein [Austropuccinia psidii MF-1]